MTPIRTSSRWILASTLLVTGCARGAPTFPSTDAWAEASPKPDGVAVDPVSLAPVGSPRGRTDGVAPVALTQPLSTALAVQTVMSFFDAVVREDTAALSALGERAFWANPSLGARGHVALSAVFAGRFRGLEYQKLASYPVVREAELEVYTEAELAHPLAGRPGKPVEMAENDVLVRAHIVTPRVGADRLFADELTFVLRPDGGRFRIALLLEDFQLPLRAMAQGAVNPHQCVKCGAPVGTGGGRCPFCGTEQPQSAPSTDRSQVAAVGLTDANRARMGRPSFRAAPPKKSNAPMVLLFVGIGFAIALVTVGGVLMLRAQPTTAPSASAAPVAPRVEPTIVGGVVLTDAQHVDATDLLPRVRKRVGAWDADAKLLEIVVTHAKGELINVTEAGTEIVVRYGSEKRDPRAPKGKDVTRQRLTFAFKPGAGEPETGPGVATDKGVDEPTCVWGAAYRAALKSGLPAGAPIDARYGYVAKSDVALWTFTAGGEVRDLDAKTCAIKGR